jgi:hypothetical protein
MRSFLPLSTLVVVLLGLAACGGKVIAGEGGGGAGGGGNTGSGGGVTGVDCGGVSGTFPTFDKTCAADADCVKKFHQINCCGTQAAIGVSASASAAFDAAEATCESQYPGCGCAQAPTTAEDGKTATSGNDQIQVACMSGQCMTFIP